MIPHPVDIVLSFVERINEKDLDGMLDLVSADVRFVDTSGEERRGAREFRKVWDRRFRAVPDHRISVAHAEAEGHRVVLMGEATDSGPFLWRVEVDGARVRCLTAFPDTPEVRAELLP